MGKLYIEWKKRNSGRNMNKILKDAKIISEYLGINCPKLRIDPDSTEGLTLEKITHLGIKDGYNRRLLIHELLHTKGFKHTYPSNFMSANVNDFGLVDFILKMYFNVEFSND